MLEFADAKLLSPKKTTTQTQFDSNRSPFVRVDVVSTAEGQVKLGTKNSQLLRSDPEIAAEATGVSVEDAEGWRFT